MNIAKRSLILKTFNYIKESKRFKGHSKWANIRHTKALKDGQRANMFAMITKRMQIAIAQVGSPKPDENPQLSRLIEQAKKANMPSSTLKGFLEKMQNPKIRSHAGIIEVRGPKGSALLIHLLTDNLVLSRNKIYTLLRKCGGVSYTDVRVKNMFHYKGVIVTEFNDIDKATDDAIEAGAEEVEELAQENERYLQFTCEPVDLLKVRNNLEKQNYKIITMDEEYVPFILTSLPDSDMERIEKLLDKLSQVPEVVKVDDNIQPNSE